MEILLSKTGLYLLSGAGIAVLILYIRYMWIKEGREKERAKMLKEEAKARDEYQKNYDRAVNMPEHELNERLRKLRGKE
ncbi:hypothetical protein Dip518_001494 [Parelusimicrobium proximum]